MEELCAICGNDATKAKPLPYELYNRTKVCYKCFTERVRGCRKCFELFPEEMVVPDAGQKTSVCVRCIKIKSKERLA